MNAVSAPPTAAGPAAASAAPTATGNNALPGNEALPADFASMLKALQPAANGPADPAAPIAKIAGVLAELRKSPADEGEGEAKLNPVELALMLGQLNAQVTGPGAGQGAAPSTLEFSLETSEVAADTRKGMTIATALAQTRRTDAAAGLAGSETAEPAPEPSAVDNPTVPAPAAWRGAELAQARSVPTEPVKLDVATAVQSPNWSTEVGQRVVWMARNNVSEAQLSINPPQLGPIEITLSLNDDHASARFVSPYAEVRDLLEQALPRLREMLAGAGVQLGQSDVGAQSQQAFQQFFGGHGGSSGKSPSFRDEHPSLQAPAAVIRTGAARMTGGNGLVDTFV